MLFKNGLWTSAFTRNGTFPNLEIGQGVGGGEKNKTKQNTFQYCFSS